LRTFTYRVRRPRWLLTPGNKENLTHCPGGPSPRSRRVPPPRPAAAGVPGDSHSRRHGRSRERQPTGRRGAGAPARQPAAMPPGGRRS